MADDQGKGWHGDPEEHAKAGAKSSGHTGDHEEHVEAGKKGGQAAQQGGAHELTEEEKSKGGKVSSSEQDMSELGRKGGSN